VAIDREIDELNNFQLSLGDKRTRNPVHEQPGEISKIKRLKENTVWNKRTIGDHLAQADTLDLFGKESLDPEADNYLQEYVKFYKNQTGNYEKEFEKNSEDSESILQDQQAQQVPNYKKIMKKRDLENRKKRKNRRQANKVKRAEQGNSRKKGKPVRDKRISKDSKRLNRKR